MPLRRQSSCVYAADLAAGRFVTQPARQIHVRAVHAPSMDFYVSAQGKTPSLGFFFCGRKVRPRSLH